MSELKNNSTDANKVSCDVCLKEIPKSEAKVEEAADYVAYFCGLECYDKWHKENDKAG